MPMVSRGMFLHKKSSNVVKHAKSGTVKRLEKNKQISFTAA